MNDNLSCKINDQFFHSILLYSAGQNKSGEIKKKHMKLKLNLPNLTRVEASLSDRLSSFHRCFMWFISGLHAA